MLLAYNFEVITLLLLSFWSGDWLNERYKMEFDWKLVTFTFGLLVIGHSGFVFYKILRKKMAEESRAKD